MNELEKAIPAEETATPRPSAEGQEPQAAEAAAPVVTESEEASAEAAPAVADESAESAQTDDAQAEEQQNYFSMSKEELVAVLKDIVENRKADHHKNVAVLKQAFYVLRNAELEAECEKFAAEATPGESFTSAPDPVEIEFKDLLGAFKEMRAAYLAEEEERRQNNLARKNEIIDRLKAIAADIDNVNVHINEVRELQEEFKKPADVPPTAVTDLWKTYQLIVEQIYDCLKMNKELRELDFKKNLEIKQSLVEQARMLADEADVINAFKKLQALHDLWRATGPVAKEYREEIWAQFKEASTLVNKRHQDFFEARKQEEQANEEAKTRLCEEIEAINIDEIKTFGEFEKVTESIKNMQARWKELGFASRKVNNALYTRFRKACDDFFTRKAEFFTKTKEELASNLEKKIKLCERAEALKDSTDFKATAEQIIALQAEWKTIGSVARRHSDSIWQRFMAACNHFFDARKKDMAGRRQEENENLAAKRLVIEALKAIPSDASRSEVIEALKEQQARWNAIGHVPFKVKDKLYDEYRSTLNAIRENFDLRESRARMNNFEKRLESMSGDGRQINSERQRLVRALEQKRGELKTFENNLGFFNIKSKEGNNMLREMERRTQRIKDEIKELEQKIKLFDEKTAK
ncbi:MAG: DUF349 domain-containing protein [Bacteroidales bacterium]|nr:DUF349 domain-containing protein [Bacteroidales bacterium]